MKTISTFINDNIRYLQQADELIAGLSDAAFAEPAPGGLGSSVGAHLRHCLDHYQSFLRGLPDARIDYDARQREPDLETQRSAARLKIAALRQGLADAADTADRPVMVQMDCGGQTDENFTTTESSLRRELQFLISHTVHHYAIIKMILTARGIPVAQDFGMAPSTLRYHQGATPCAH